MNLLIYSSYHINKRNGEIIMKVGILGTGFGKHHTNIYKKIDAIESITIFGRNKEKLDTIHKDIDRKSVV